MGFTVAGLGLLGVALGYLLFNRALAIPEWADPRRHRTRRLVGGVVRPGGAGYLAAEWAPTWSARSRRVSPRTIPATLR